MAKSKKIMGKAYDLECSLTKLIAESPCDYEDVIFLLQKQLNWMKKARDQEHGRNPDDKKLSEMPPATLLRQFGIIRSPWATADADAIRAELHKRLKWWRVSAAEAKKENG